MSTQLVKTAAGIMNIRPAFACLSRRMLTSQALKSTSVQELLRLHAFDYDDGWSFLRIQQCPKAKRAQHQSPLFVSKSTGQYLCFGCMRSGESMQDLEELLRSSDMASSLGHGRKQRCSHQAEHVFSGKLALWQNSVPIITAEDSIVVGLDRALAALHLSALSVSTLEKWKARWSPSTAEILIPSFWPDKSTVIGYVSLSDNDSFSAGHPIGLQTITHARQSEVILTDSPVSALCAFQGSGGKPTCAVPLMCSSYKSLPDWFLASLERFKRIYLWPSSCSDTARRSNSLKPTLLEFVRQLGQQRCKLVNLDSSATDSLGDNSSFREALNSAFSLLCNEIIHFDSLRDEVRAEIEQADRFAGVKWTRFPSLNHIMKGHRPGELTILTGSTGCGKTTFLSEYSLDLCVSQNVPTLWGSFEIKNTRLAKNMLIQFAGGHKQLLDMNAFNKYADAFASLNLHFMNFHGAESMQKVSAVMAAAVLTHGIKHVIIDNLQFMMGMEYANADRFYRQDLTVHILRKFSTLYNCHVTLVIHPRKENLADGERLGIQSIFGSAKAAQEADNVMIIQQEKQSGRSANRLQFDHRCLDTSDSYPAKYLDVVKNRFDGELGKMPLVFNKHKLSFALPLKLTISDDHEGIL